MMYYGIIILMNFGFVYNVVLIVNIGNGLVLVIVIFIGMLIMNCVNRWSMLIVGIIGIIILFILIVGVFVFFS